MTATANARVFDTATDSPKAGELLRTAVKADGVTIGWVVTRATAGYDAIPIGLTPTRYGCETFSSAVAYIQGVFS